MLPHNLQVDEKTCDYWETRLNEAAADSPEANIQRQLDFMRVAHDEFVEIQALQVKEHGYPNSYTAHGLGVDELGKLAAGQVRAPGVYMIGNVLDPAVFSRRPCGQWHRIAKGEGTSDGDVTHRRVLNIDVDPTRPSGTSATDEEAARAHRVACAVYVYVTDFFGVESVAFGNSGNGRSLLVALDLIPETPEVKTVVARFLKALDAVFSTDSVKIDTSVGDAKRLIPLFGTTKRKGAPGIPDRPHRRTALVTPENVAPVSLDGLEELTSRTEARFPEHFPTIGDRESPTKDRTSPHDRHAPGKRPASSSGAHVRGTNVFKSANAVNVALVLESRGLLKDGIPVCPGCGESQGVSIINNGLKCHHNRCYEKGVPERAGFRTPVDIVALVDDIAPIDAARKIVKECGGEDDQRPALSGKKSTVESRWTSTVADATSVLVHDPRWAGVLRYDAFGQRIEKVDPPWHEDDAPAASIARLEWQNEDDTRCANWLLRERGIKLCAKSVHEAVRVVAQGNAYHPVRDWLSSLEWDGTFRLQSWLQTYFRAPDTEYVRKVGFWWLISAVARVLDPGCKADHALVLEGPQGIGKSSGVRALLPDPKWFHDSDVPIGDKDSYLVINGRWIVEFAELDSLRKAEVSAIKKYLSSCVDIYRPPYGRTTIEVPRQVVFVGTVNHSEYLRDDTGNRRFWPVPCGAVDTAGLSTVRNQLWAEALQAYRFAEHWWPSSAEEEELCSVQQEDRREVDSWEDKIASWLSAHPSHADCITVAEVLEDALGYVDSEGRPRPTTKADSNRVAGILRNQGYTRTRGKADASGHRPWQYVRKDRT